MKNLNVMITKYSPAYKQLKNNIKRHWKLIQQNKKCAELFKKEINFSCQTK